MTSSKQKTSDRPEQQEKKLKQATFDKQEASYACHEKRQARCKLQTMSSKQAMRDRQEQQVKKLKQETSDKQATSNKQEEQASRDRQEQQAGAWQATNSKQ